MNQQNMEKFIIIFVFTKTELLMAVTISSPLDEVFVLGWWHADPLTASQLMLRLRLRTWLSWKFLRLEFWRLRLKLKFFRC